jgi:uncharacterized protein
VGGGFFATIGLAIVGARGATYVSFLAGGLIALLTAYSYVGLTRRYPGAGGTLSFVQQAYGPGLFSASVGTLLILSYVAIVAVYAHALGAYSAAYFPPAQRDLPAHLFGSLAIVALALVNLRGGGAIRRSENAFVVGKLAVLMAFIVAGFALGPFAWERFDPARWVSARTILSSGIVAFLSYEGFELIANASGHITDLRRTLPFAFYGSVLCAIVIYVLVTLVAIGHTPFEQLGAAQDFALSAAAAQFMGPFGFGLLALGAVLASASAINADLFGSARMPVLLAEQGEAPRSLYVAPEETPVKSLFVLTALALVAVNLLNLHAISAATSGGFLIVFATVNLAAARLSRETGSTPWIPLVAACACVGALGTLLWGLISNPSRHSSLLAVAAIALLAVGLQLAFRTRTVTGRPPV